MRKKVNLINIIITFVIISAGLVFLQSCENNPNDLGLEFILSDTLNTKLLDSNKDSLLITNNNFKKFVNTYPSPYFIIGNYQGYESKSFLRAVNVSNSYAGATVLSARIKINYAEYDFKDSLGTVAFNIYSLNKYYNFSTITNDSITSGSYGSNLLGSYSGSVTDTNSIYLAFDNTTAKNWLEYAADTNYAGKNYGVAFLPNASSNTIKAFGGYNNLTSNLNPKVIIVANKNNKTDTLSFDMETVSFSDIQNPSILQNRIVVQNGISFNSILNFDLSKLASKVIINDAYLRLRLDQANSYITPVSNKTMQYSLMLDTAAKTNDGTAINTLLEDSVTFTVHLTPYFQKWNYGIASNFGVLLRNGYNVLNLDKFVFYGPGVQDTALRPKLLIRYTPRGN